MADEKTVAAAEAEENATEALAPVAENQSEELDISEKLKNAAGNIRRAGAGARTRKSESEKSRKQTEAEAQARLEEAERKLKEDEERARLVAEQKLAALDYAQNYRKKLQKDRQKAMSAAKAREKAEREAAEAAAREQRAKEIAELLEKERNEAKERGEKSSELLNRVTKRAVVDESGKVRMVDKIDLLKEQAEAEKAEAAAKEAALAAEAKAREAAEKALAEARAKEAREAAARAAELDVAPRCAEKKEAARREVEQFLEGEMMRVDGDSFVLDIEDDVMTVSLTDKDDPSIIPQSMIGDSSEPAPECEPDACAISEEKLAAALAEHEEVLRAIQENSRVAKEEMRRMLDEEQERFAKQTEALKAHSEELSRLQEERRRDLLAEIAALAAIAAARAPKEEPAKEPVEEPTQEPAQEPEEESVAYDPIVNNDPVVLALRERGNSVSTKRQLKKYIKKSNKAVKKIEKKLAAYEEARRISDEARSRVALCYSMNECGKILEIRCDNLSAAARIRHDKLTKKLRLGLYSEIERYNRKATEFCVETGEPLTRVSAFLPDHLTNNTGKAVIPALAYRDRYEQLTPDDPEMPKTYVVSFPSVSTLKAGESTEAVSSVVAVGGEKKKNPITTKTVVEPALYERDLLSGRSEGVSKKSFKKLRKLAKKAYKAIDKKSRRLGAIVTPEAAVADLLLARESVLVGSRVLVDAVKLGNAKWVGKSRIKLEELFGLYNKKAGVCERICKTSVTKIHPLTASKVAEAMLVPDMPDMVHVNELFETVGDSTRVVGDPSGKKSDDPDGSFTFLVGGSKSTDLASVGSKLAATENSPAADKAGAFGGASVAKVNQGQFYSVKGMPYPPMCIGAYVGGSAPAEVSAAVAAAEGGTSQTATVQGVDAPVFHGPLSGKKLADFRKKSEGEYKDAKIKLAEISFKRQSAKGDDKVELDLRALTVEKELIDSLADCVYVAGASSDKKLLKVSRRRLSEEIEAHNELVDELGLISGVQLSKVPDSYYDSIVSGNGYERVPKIEYQVTEQPSVYYVNAGKSSQTVNGTDGSVRVAEISGALTSPIGEGISKKMYSSYVSENEKAYKDSQKTVSSVIAERKGTKGERLVELEAQELSVRKESIDRLCENLSVARNAGDTKLEKTSKARLKEEIKAHNALVAQIERDGGAKLTPVSEGVIEDILAGRGYRKTPKLEYTSAEGDNVQAVVVGGNVEGSARLSERSAAEAILAGSASEKVLESYVKKHNKSYLSAKKSVDSLEKANKGVKGDKLVNSEIEQLAEERLIIDDLCEGLAVAVSSGNEAYAKTTKKRLLSEIKNHNAMVERLKKDGGVNLSPVSESVVDDIVAGNGYRKCAKIELKRAQGETVQQVAVAGAAVASGIFAEEISGADMSKKELKQYKAENDKSYKSAEKRIAAIEKSAKGKKGNSVTEAEVEKINVKREIIDGLCRNIAVAESAGDKAYAKAQAKKLTAEIKEHNKLISEFEKESGVKLATIDEGTARALLEGKGYTKSPRLEFKVEGESDAHRLNNKNQTSTADVRVLNLTNGALTTPALSGKALKKFKKSGEKEYSALSKEADSLAKSRKSAKGGERVDIDIKELELRKSIIDGLCDTAIVAQSSGDAKLLKNTEKRLRDEVKAHNALVDDLQSVGGITLTKASDKLYDEVVSGKGYRRVPRINLEVAEYAPAQQVVYVEKDAADDGKKGKKADKKNVNVAVISQSPETLSKKQIARRIKENEKTAKVSEKQIDDLKTKNKVAVGIEKHKILVGLLNSERAKLEAEASTLALLTADGSKSKIKKQRKKLNESIQEYNRLTAEYKDYTGDELTGADTKMADKIIGGQPFERVRELEMSVVSKGYEYSYADYVSHDNKRNAGRDLAEAQSQADAEKQNAINYELASLKNVVKRQADKDNRTVAAAFMYSKGLIQCEDDSRNYSYGIKKSKSRKQGNDIVARCKKIDVNGKRALSLENEANKRYYEVVTTNPKSVEPVGKKRRFKLLPFFKKKYTSQDIVYLRDEIMRLLNERDRVNGQLISIYEGQVMDLGGKPLTLDIRRVKSKAAKKMYNSRSTKVMAKKVDKHVVDLYDREVLYGYINDQIEAESNIAVIDYRLKHAKADNLTPYEIDQLKYDRKAQQKAKARAESQFKRTYRSASENSDSGLVWLIGLGLLVLAVVGVAVGLAWFFGPNLLDNLKNWFGIGG